MAVAATAIASAVINSSNSSTTAHYMHTGRYAGTEIGSRSESGGPPIRLNTEGFQAAPSNRDCGKKDREKRRRKEKGKKEEGRGKAGGGEK